MYLAVDRVLVWCYSYETMKTTVCQFNQDGIHVEIDYIYYDEIDQIPTSYVATIWIARQKSEKSVSRHRIGIKSFGSLQSAQRWINKQLEYSTYLHLANKVYED